MKDVEREIDPDAIKSPGEEQESEPEEEIRIGMIKRCKDGSEWLITHFCDVCKVGLCSERQLEAHNAGKPHEKKVCSLPIAMNHSIDQSILYCTEVRP